ncbi:MAG: malectin [Sedimentisphaerales bacterium]|nr:malectin [Sedimentisphaerales bacterium]
MIARLFVATYVTMGLLMGGCSEAAASETKTPQATEAPKTAEMMEAAKAPAAPKPAEAPTPKIAFRINCGATEPYTDKAGHLWVADQDFDSGKTWGADDGVTVDRGSLALAGTDAPRVYELERYSMDSYKFIVPNGKYTVRLHFAETYEGIMGAGERVFSVSIGGREVLKDFDVFKEAGGDLKPLVKEFKGIPVEGGQLVIDFEPNIENPEINGIEVLAE